MSYFPVSQSLTRNVKIASFNHPISRTEVGLLDRYQDSLERLKQIRQQHKKESNNEVIDQCLKSETLALEKVKDTLNRVQNAQYGICQTCHKPIAERRLTILPDIKHCFDCSH